MKSLIKIALTAILFTFTIRTQAQDARSLVKEGNALNNAHNYAAAIEKYKAALTLEPDNPTANYQMAFALNASGKGTDALPYLQKVVQSKAPQMTISSAYNLMGVIYDEGGQAQKAVDSYREAIKIDSTNYALHYGLGLASFRSHQYSDAEQSAIAAIRLAPGQAAPWRLYGLVIFHQNKRAAALLGLCTFLWLEPVGPHSNEANENIQHIIQGGELKPEPGVMRPHFIEANTNALNQAITQAVAETAKRRNITAADQFSEQLQVLFAAIGQLTEKQSYVNPFFKQLAAHYYQLSQTPYVPAFAHTLRQSTDKAAGAWLKAHPQQVNGLAEWMKGNGTGK